MRKYEAKAVYAGTANVKKVSRRKFRSNKQIYKNVEVLQRDHVFRLKIVLKLANVKKRFQNEIQSPNLHKIYKNVKVL